MSSEGLDVGGRRWSSGIAEAVSGAEWELFVQVTSKELTQAEGARKWRVDAPTVIGIRRTVKGRVVGRAPALSRGPGRTAVERGYELEAARDDIAALTKAVKTQAIELAVTRERRLGW